MKVYKLLMDGFLSDHKAVFVFLDAMKLTCMINFLPRCLRNFSIDVTHFSPLVEPTADSKSHFSHFFKRDVFEIANLYNSNLVSTGLIFHHSLRELTAPNLTRNMLLPGIEPGTSWSRVEHVSKGLAFHARDG